jgi:hypothetical protein
MDKNTLAHTTWECKYHIEFGSVNLLSIYKNQIHPLCLGNSYNIAAISKAP